jgi:hypothetical protein
MHHYSGFAASLRTSGTKSLCYNRGFKTKGLGQLRRAQNRYVLGLVLAVCIATVAGCGSSSSTSNNQTQPLTNIKKRVLVSNESGVVRIVDASRDTLSTKTLAMSAPTKMVTAGGFTIIGQNATFVGIYNNAKEALDFNTPTADVSSDVAVSPDGSTAWIAERNVGLVQAVSTSSGAVVANIPIPNVVRLSMSPSGTRLLAFTDTLKPLANADNFWVIDTNSVVNTASKIASPVTAASLDQPFNAVFNGSETQALILNCGRPCGGTGAGSSVSKIDFTTPAAPNTIATVPVLAATTGLISGTSLFVAGTPLGSAFGTLQVIDTGSLAVVGGASQIADGLHLKMAITTNNRLYIASKTCTPGPINAANQQVGCLSIANISAAPGASGLPIIRPLESAFRQNLDVTGFQQVSGRNIMYVVQGGEFDIFDTTLDAPSPTITQIDIVGVAFDAVQIDP